MTNVGLKSFLSVLGPIFEETPIALYERQKSLVAEGLLQPMAGRGPGSGVRATPETVAILATGMLASVELTGSGRRTRVIAEGQGGPGLSINFLEELTRILSDEAKAAQQHWIRVNPEAGTSTIRYGSGPDDYIAFVGARAPKRPRLITITIETDTIRALAAAVSKLGAVT
jgi:hypothetical protein